MNSWLGASVGLAVGLTGLVAGGELLVRGASRLATALLISPLVIGLTVVAFGTSAPELAVSIQAALSQKGDLALGNVVGSNIFNVLLILGLSALITPLVVSSRLIRWDLPWMVGVSVALLGLGLDGRIGRLEGSMLFLGLLGYTYWCIRQSRRESRAIQGEFAELVGKAPPQGVSWGRELLLVIAGLGLLCGGSHFFIQGAVFVAGQLGVSELVIGLTIVAAGTSLPEVVTSLVAAARGERDIAVGNVIGSNIFNILGVLGLSSALSPTGVTVADEALRFDLPVMVATAIACLPIFFTGHLIARWEGALFLGYYVAYTTYLILVATQAEVTQAFESVMLAFVFPLTAVTVVVCTVRSLRSPNGKHPGT